MARIQEVSHGQAAMTTYAEAEQCGGIIAMQ